MMKWFTESNSDKKSGCFGRVNSATLVTEIKENKKKERSRWILWRPRDLTRYKVEAPFPGISLSPLEFPGKNSERQRGRSVWRPPSESICA